MHFHINSPRCINSALMNFSVTNLWPTVVSYSSYYYFVTEFGDTIGNILYYFEGKIQLNMKPNQSYSEMTKFAGIFFNSAILLGLFVYYFLNKRGKTLSLNTSLLPENNAAFAHQCPRNIMTVRTQSKLDLRRK